MAKYDYGGGCACGLQAECDCEHGGKTVARHPSELKERVPYKPGKRQCYPTITQGGDPMVTPGPNDELTRSQATANAVAEKLAKLKPPLLTAKDTNPKDAVGTRKPPMSVVPMGVMLEVGVGMLEGARKYGRHNYRIAGVRASVYVDAAMRHLIKFWDFGLDIDKDSGLSEVTKAITSLVVLRDAMMTGKWVNDRPPPLPIELLDMIQTSVDDVFARYPESLPAYTHEHVKPPEEK